MLEMLSSFLYEISHDSLWYWKVGIWIWTHLFVIWNHVDIEEVWRSLISKTWSFIRLDHLDVSVCQSHVAQAASQLCQTSDLGLLKEIFVLQLGANPSCSTVVTFQPGEIFKKNKNTFDVCVFSNTQGVEFVLFFDLLSHLSLLSLHPHRCSEGSAKYPLLGPSPSSNS